MDANQAKTLSQNFPDVLLALLKRMNSAERAQVLKSFASEFPRDFKAWHTADVKSYLKYINAR